MTLPAHHALPRSRLACTRPALTAAAITALLLAACGTTPTGGDAQALVSPPPALQLTGVPPVPRSVADAVAKYTESAGHGLVGWHPQQRALLITHRPAGANTNQLFALQGPQGAMQALTDSTEPIANAWYEPRQGRSIVLARGNGGDEA